MKKLILCSLLLCLLFACSNESDFASSENPNSPQQIKEKLKFPLNSDNPFDAKGKKYYDAVQLYFKSNNTPNSIEDITNQITFLSGIYNPKYHHKNADLGYTTQEILAILNDPSARLLEIIENCSISTSSKLQLTAFVQSLISQQDDDYLTIRDFIISFDAGIIESTVLTDIEKETILTVSTISSYALYAEAERKDRDWETSVGHKRAVSPFNNNQSSVVSIIAMLNIITKT